MKKSSISYFATSLLGVIILAASFGGLFFFVSFVPAWAQTTSAPPTQSAPSQVAQTQAVPPTQIFDKQNLQSEIAEIKRTYTGQLAEYRQAEQQFLVDRTQFNNLQTLSSLEAAVKSTQRALSLRDQVLETYFIQLRLELLNSSGIDLGLKDKALAQVELQLKALRRHREIVAGAVDRTSIDQVADDFDLLVPAIQETSLSAAQLLQLGKLQSVYDKTLLLGKDLVTLEGSAAASIEGNERRRALDQIDAKLGQTKSLLRQLNDSIIKAEEKENKTADLSREFPQLFTLLNQTLTFIKELIVNHYAQSE